MSIANISFSHLRVLSAVVERGSFSAAAEEIGITQSGVSQSLKHLEAVLGSRLLVRHRDGVATTELGGAVLADVRAALQAVERIRQTCSASRGLRSGQVRIGSVSSVAARLLPAPLAEFRKLYPGVNVSLMEGTDAEVCEWVENAVVDLGLTGETTPNVQPSVILEDDFLLVVGARHRLSKRRTVQLADLADEPFLMSTSGCEPAIRRIFSQARINPPIAFRVRDAEALVSMVGQGLGVTIMPRLAIPAKIKSIACISVAPRRKRRIVAITKRGLGETPAVQTLKAMLAGRRSMRNPTARHVREAAE
jgi:DNA-binding transcriptional LysR family regulator